MKFQVNSVTLATHLRTWVHWTWVLKKWYITSYFRNRANLPQILPKCGIWLFLPFCLKDFLLLEHPQQWNYIFSYLTLQKVTLSILPIHMLNSGSILTFNTIKQYIYYNKIIHSTKKNTINNLTSSVNTKYNNIFFYLWATMYNYLFGYDSTAIAPNNFLVVLKIAFKFF